MMTQPMRLSRFCLGKSNTERSESCTKTPNIAFKLDISTEIVFFLLFRRHSFIHALPVGRILFGFEQQTTSPNMNTCGQTGMPDHESCVDTKEARGGKMRELRRTRGMAIN